MSIKLKRITAIAILLIVLASLYAYFTMPIYVRDFNMPEIPKQLSMDKKLSSEQVRSDREKVIKSVENVHPFFLLQDVMNAYQQEKEKYIQSTSGEMTVGEFALATGDYLSFFEDGHTKISWNENAYLKIPWDFHDGKLYLRKDGTRSDIYAVSVGGQHISHILEQVEKLCPVENEMTKQTKFADYAAGRNLLLSAGVIFSNEKVLIMFSDGVERRFSFHVQPRQSTGTKKEGVNTCFIDDNIFVIDFNSCIDDEELHTLAEKLAKAVESGISKVIIDVRGNGGGNSAACKRLLEAMGMESPEYGGILRFSEEAANQNGYLRKEGSIKTKGTFEGKSNPNIDLVVLCDKYTYSSANMLLVWVRDGGLGTIIGEPSSGVPSHYGDIIYFVLDNSKLYGSISHKMFIRPDETNQERVLQPDIVTEPDEALDAAMEYLKRMD